MVVAEMLYGIAFASGCLLTFAVMLSIRRRAARRTAQQIIASVPASTADIRAERHQSRAQFTAAIRRLEATLDQLKTKCAGQSAEVGRQAAEIHQLEAELENRASQSAEIGRQAAEIHRLEGELKKRADQSAQVGRQAVDIHRLDAVLKKCASQSAELGRQAAEIQRLDAELKKRAALISVLRVRAQAQHAVS